MRPVEHVGDPLRGLKSISKNEYFPGHVTIPQWLLSLSLDILLQGRADVHKNLRVILNYNLILRNIAVHPSK